MDTSSLINFLRIDRVDLLAGYPHAFLVPDHVVKEVTRRNQHRRLAAALAADSVSETSLEPEEVELFEEMRTGRRLGSGESAAIAIAVHRRYSLAMDDKNAIKRLRRTHATPQIFRTQDLVASMIAEGLLDVGEADQIMEEWSKRHRFEIKLATFGDLFD